MNYKDTKGFTLIEMMVVIAVIGILSAAILVGLAPGRQRAKDARVINAVKQAQAVVESLVDLSTGKYPDAATVNGNDSYTRANSDAVGQNGSLVYKQVGNGAGYIISSIMPDGRKTYCVDSTGRSLVTSQSVGNADVCPGP